MFVFNNIPYNKAYSHKKLSINGHTSSFFCEFYIVIIKKTLFLLSQLKLVLCPFRIGRVGWATKAHKKNKKGPVAEWLGWALQKLLQRFESARDLSKTVETRASRGFQHLGGSRGDSYHRGPNRTRRGKKSNKKVDK